jgi:dihydrolipoamide dehydrogenase
LPASATYDLAVIGSGPGGYRAAVLGALRGLKVVLIEQGVWGGCCLNRGCVPKKVWYATAKLIAANRGYGERGIDGCLSADLTKAWQHQRRVVEQTRLSYRDYLARLGVQTIQGQARLAARGLLVDHRSRIDAGHIIIATGATASEPPGLKRSERILSTDDLFELPLPSGRRVAVIGAGAVATEMAFILTMLGCEVRWIARRAPLAAHEFSPVARQTLRKALAGYAIVPRLGNDVCAAADLGAEVTLKFGDGHIERVDWVLLGTGRTPNTAELSLDAAGVERDARGFIVIDAHCRTSVPGVFAIGDVVNARMSANLALADAATAIDDIITPGAVQRSPERVSSVIYSALELACIGKNEDQAEAENLEVATGFASFATNPAALGEDAADGYVRLIADVDRGTLIGAEVVGSEAGDLIGIVAQAMRASDALRVLANSGYNHPSRGEEIQNAVQTLASQWGMAKAIFRGAP